ncbi:hypothetical protein LUZ63_009529 [Rhynchospora breviuscula]|uniref:Agenet domain-containing protein n=1 Tax=Rhynchospora breviuscula TaxID=2022672 RepID=A0A9Q0HNN5_9POAL|nr:hypothetical protein LUZ63_009529 [Rhynchospora breviuscula]
MAMARNQNSVPNAPSGFEIDGGASISQQTSDSKLTGKPFPAGTEVEVRISSEGFHGSWYEAIVLSHYKVTFYSKRYSKYKVQYLEFLRDDGSGEKLVEHVFAKNVRPRAPRRFTSHGPSFSLPSSEGEDPNIKMHDLVEAFHNDGWWHGVISGLRHPDTGLYTVYFPNSRDVFQFKPADIRTQSTFANGRWFRLLKVQQNTETYKEGDKVEVFWERDDCGPSFFPAQVEKVIHHSYYLVKYESPDARPNGNLTEIVDPEYLRPAVDCMPLTNLFTVDSHVEVFHQGGWSPGVVSSGLSESNYAVTVKSKGESMTIQFHVSNMRLRLEWDGNKWSKWRSPSKGKKRKSVSPSEIISSNVSLDESESPPDSVTFPGKKMKKGREENLGSDDEAPDSKFSGVEPESSKSTSKPSRIMRAVRKVSQSSELLTKLKKCHSKISTSKRSSTCKRKIYGSASHEKQGTVDNNPQASSKKKKDVNLSNESSSDVLQPNTYGGKETAHVMIPPCEQNLSSNTNCAADFAGENSVGISPPDRTMAHIANSEGQCLLSTRDTLTDDVAKNYGDQDKISSPRPSRLVPSVNQAAPLLLSENSVSTDPNCNSEFNKNTLVEHILVNPVAPDIVLPFEKTSPIWKSLETTLKVFSHIPQRPHFKTLESECKETREGTAIGMMVNYSNLAESIHSLSTHTEVTVFEEKFACLRSLEDNGFIVDPITSRLQFLFEIKTNCSKSALKRVELDTDLANKEEEYEDRLASANACEAKLADIRKRISELKEQEKAVLEERAKILDLAAKHDHIISRLKDEIFSINMCDELASEVFGRIALERLY